MIPTSLPDMIWASGLFGWLICLLAPALLAMLLVAMRKRQRSFSLVFLGASFLPILSAFLGSLLISGYAFRDVAANPHLLWCSSDLIGYLCTTGTPFLLGAVVSGISVCAASLSLALCCKKESV